jgi:Fe-S-cluster-containing dehydrogenase component/anaerobic selenocysteine-containing dehydrogenase
MPPLKTSLSLPVVRQPEFPPGAEPPETFTSRRSFVQLLGAGVALGAAGCLSRPAEKIAPYTRRPLDLAPGNPLHYATCATVDGFATGLLVTAWEGRPTKVEGNPDHPSSRGAAGLLEQASLQSLYDPQRARQVRHRGTGRAWRSFLLEMKALGERHRADGGAKLRFLVEPSASPLLAEVRAKVLAAFPKARFRAYASISRDAILEGSELAFGAPLEVSHDFSQAAVIAALDADFLGSLPGTLQAMRDFARRREPGAEMNRLYSAEPQLTTTGGCADHRLRLRAGEVAALAAALAQQVGALPGAAGAALSPEATKWVAALAKDLQRNRGRSLVIAGERQPAAVHAAVHAINAALGNSGKTVKLLKPSLSDATIGARTGPAALRELADEINRGEVESLVVTAWNPIYSAPADIDFAAALGKVANVIYTSLFEDETSARASWFLPAAHPLESWGDGRAHNGTITFRQPLIAPLHGGVTEVEVLTSLIGEAERSPYERLRELHRGAARGAAQGDFETIWTKWISDGLLPGTERKHESAQLRTEAISTALGAVARRPADGLELVFAPDYRAWDGRFANNAWLQELPDPISKLTWDNAALISPATARRLGLESGQLVELELRSSKIRAPVYVVPGQADESLTLPLGYGRGEGAETTARGVGFDFGRLRRSDAFWFAGGARLTKVDGPPHPFAATHTHWSMEGRPLALDVKLSELREHKLPAELEEQRVDHPAMYEPHQYPGNKWAMAIDLGKCTGCSACVVACQAENNIPIVGKEQVLKSREMQWLRIDRYYQGPIDDPTLVTQPVACVHCELAPCEYVCPVNATVHSDEGLNEMVYNRCVGTRYCSNNCPYKARRFNFLRYNNDYQDVEKMKFNPDVTVRSRGVMEKCTYCVQRIERVRIDARVSGTDMKDGDIVTACQQACPAEAIIFGSLADPNSRVSKLQREERSYRLLNELNTKPRTWHLARVRNPNPELG